MLPSEKSLSFKTEVYLVLSMLVRIVSGLILRIFTETVHSDGEKT